jgi:hypothetical protein
VYTRVGQLLGRLLNARNVNIILQIILWIDITITKNPYGPLNPNFYQTMADFVSTTTSPCYETSDYGNFGVIAADLGEYFGSDVGTGEFYRLICDTIGTTPTRPIFSISSGSGTAHCVLYVGSEIWDEDVNNIYSKITVMDPYEGNFVIMKANEFLNKYQYYY